MIKKIRAWNKLIRFIIHWRKQQNHEFLIITTEKELIIKAQNPPRKSIRIDY